jgi:hypothetical protein
MKEWRDLTWVTHGSDSNPMCWAATDDVPGLRIYRLQGRSPWADQYNLNKGDIAAFAGSSRAYVGHVLGAMAFIREFQLSPEFRRACVNKDRTRD